VSSIIPNYAPGCFGSAIAFQKAELTCKSCSFMGNCGPVALHNAQLLRAKFGIAEPAFKPVLKAPEVVEDRPAFRLPQRVQNLLDKLDNGNFDVVGKLQRGENPFDKTMPTLRVACHLLLRLKRPIDRETLTMAYVSHLKLQPETARIYARVAIYALTHVGAVISNDGLISLKENANA